MTEISPEPAGTQPWHLTFDFAANHCSVGIDAACEDLTDDDLTAEHKEQLKNASDEDAYELLNTLASQARDAVEEAEDEAALFTDLTDEAEDQMSARLDVLMARADRLEEAAGKLTFCHGYCCCASDVWDSDQDYFDEALSELGDHVWAVTRSGRDDDEDDVDGVLTVASMFDILRWREGWSEIDLRWDGTSVTVSFADDCGGSAELVLTALSAEQAVLYGRWQDADRWDETIAAKVVRTDPRLLEESLTLWESLEKDDHPFEFADLLAAVSQLGMDALTAEMVSVACTLAPDWESSVADLFAVAGSILAGAAPVPDLEPVADVTALVTARNVPLAEASYALRVAAA